MIDMELFELMKVTLKEVLRAKLRGSPDKWAQPVPSEVADRAFDLALAAKQRLERYRPSEPIHDPHAPTLHPPPITNRTCARCCMRALHNSDFCKDHQP
jgi:hypothetical protein